MKTLDDIISDLARKGRITHITLAVTGKVDKKNPDVWQAGFRDTGNAGYRIEIGRDPVECLKAVLLGGGESQSKVQSTTVPVTKKRRVI